MEIMPMINQFFSWDFWLSILKSPIVLFVYIAILLMGYGIAYLLFWHNKELIRDWREIYHVFGCGYTALIFIIVNFKKIFSRTSPINIDEIIKLAPQALLLSFALLFIVIIVVTIARLRTERRGGKLL